MKCKKCKEVIEDEFVSVNNEGGLIDHAADFGANAENLEPLPTKDYYHRKCFNKRLEEIKNAGT